MGPLSPWLLSPFPMQRLPRGRGGTGTYGHGCPFPTHCSSVLLGWGRGGALRNFSSLRADLWWVWGLQRPGFKHLLLLLWSQNSLFSFYANFLFCRAVIMLQVTLCGSLPTVIGIFSYHCTLQKWLPWICNISFNGLNYSFT